MSQYRKRFVQFNMLLIGIVLTIMVAAVAGYMIKDYYTGLRTTMEQVVAPLRSFSQAPQGHPTGAPKSQTDRENRKNILVVFYSKEKNAYAMLSPNDAFSDGEIPALLEAIVAQEQDFGVLRQHHAIYYRSGSSPFRIAIASTDYIVQSVLRLGLVLLAIWLGAMLLFLAISIQLSAIAARPMEEAMQREKQFVADASHDLKTPLSVILANNAILAENPDAPVGSLSRWLDSTQAAAKRMQQLISQMLTLADVERPDALVVLERVDLASLAMRAALELESLAYEKNITLDTELPEECFIRGDSGYLLRIVSSLLENALKYEPEGGRVLLRLIQEKKKNLLSVQNFGTQIPQEDLPHVFDRFYRSDKSRQNDSNSFGLGLAITRQMIQRLGGDISAASSPEEGTIFRVTF
mgnify:CR=1 FL=1